MRKQTVSGRLVSNSVRTALSSRSVPSASARKTTSTSQPAALAPERRPRVKSDSVPAWLSRKVTRVGFFMT